MPKSLPAPQDSALAAAAVHLLADCAANGSEHMMQRREGDVLEYPLCEQCTSAPRPSHLCSFWGAREPGFPASSRADDGYVNPYGIAQLVVAMDCFFRYFLQQF